jgi:hypothetical protein
MDLARTKPENIVGSDISDIVRIDDAAPIENEAKVDTSIIGRTGAPRGSQIPFLIVLVIVALAAAAVGLYVGGVIRI